MFRLNIISNYIKRDLKQLNAYKLSFIGKVINIIFILTIFNYISVNIADKKYFAYLLLGIAFLALIRSTIFSGISTIETERTQGTLAYLLSLPQSALEFLIGSSCSKIIAGILEAFFILFIGVTVFKAELMISSPDLILAILITVISIISLTGISFILSAISLLFKKGSSLSWVFTAVLITSGEVFFPSNLLPGWISWISLFNPAHYTLLFLRNILLRGYLPESISSLQFFILLTFLYFLMGIFLFNRVLRQVKRNGTLEHF